ncbi:MAG TPA: valine--tRNA ligase [Bacillota bacterium]|nr:valine--tRNA ligase [Bacillota bacterium]
MKHYDAQEVEEKIRKFWDKEKIYKFDGKKKGKIYSIDTPPPYASAGHLHVGHALSYTQFEIIARIMRQMGRNVYFPPGYDDNGLPTEKYVEEKLGIQKSKTNRAEFRKICLKESEKIEKVYTENVFKKLGHSYDWDLLYTTISPEAQKVSQTAFLKLVKKGDCYRSKEPVIWCPHHETALAQAEVEDLGRKTKINYIDFDLAEGGKINIATTRPEFLPACVAIFVNPKDKKNKSLIGKEVLVPLFNYKVKVMADESVDPEFGTGTMMVCTFGDNADIEKWKRYKLELRNILNKDGTLNENTDEYEGMKLEEARARIITNLKETGRLKKQEPSEQTVGSCWRCGTPVEYIIAKQWFIKTLKYKKDLIKRGREIKWYPDFMRKRFENWTENLGWDWIISRQRFYGVPIPVWYCEDCDKIILPDEKELPLDPMEKAKKCGKCGKETIPDTDVLDTWMTSSNTPEVSSRWLEKPNLYKKIVPMSLRPQSHDIIRTWAFYTILKSHLLFNRIPWKDVVINTFVLDAKGRGMSKSKGNAVWADELIKKYNVDALRYWVGSASLGSDLPFNENELVAGKKFLNKLWNASNFVFMNVGKTKPKKPKKLEAVDELFLQETFNLVNEVKENFSKYNIAEGKRKIEHFFWKMFCDNYLEMVKKRVYQGKGNEKLSAEYALYESLLMILKLISPITPFITEELYQTHYKSHEKTKSIHLCEWPESIKMKKGKEWDSFIKIISKIRQEKTKAKKSMNAECIVTLSDADYTLLKTAFFDDLKAVTNAKEIKTGKFKVEFI